MHKKQRILIIEDNREIVLGMTVRLRAAGYEVITAYDGQAGLEAVKRSRPDAIVLDIRMPVMDGLTVLTRLGEDAGTKAIPVVVLSANVAEAARRKALELGARYFLEKPYDAAKLLQAIQSALSQAAPGTPDETASGCDRKSEPGASVLIADDNRDLVKFLKLRCQDLGLSVRTAFDGMQALQQIREDIPDLAILDLDMPAADGLSICEMLVADPEIPPIPVVILSGKLDAETIRRCESLGVHYVRKGIDAWGNLRPKIFELLPGVAPDPSAVSECSGAVTSSRPPPKVLVVDDDPLICRALKTRLEAYGIEVHRAQTGTQGYSMTLEVWPDVIVSDLTMPDGCGNYLLGRLKSSDITKDIPIIFLSGHKVGNRQDYGLERDILSRGAAAFLNKPLEFNELLRQLRWHIEFPERPQVA